MRPRRRILLVIAVLVLAGALFELLPPVLIRWIVDDHLAVGKSEGLLVLALAVPGRDGARARASRSFTATWRRPWRRAS